MTKIVPVQILVTLVSVILGQTSAASTNNPMMMPCPDINPPNIFTDLESIMPLNYSLIEIRVAGEVGEYVGPCPQVPINVTANYAFDFSSITTVDLTLATYEYDGTFSYTHVVVFSALDNNLHIVYTCADAQSLVAFYQRPGSNVNATAGAQVVEQLGIMIGDYFTVCS